MVAPLIPADMSDACTLAYSWCKDHKSNVFDVKRVCAQVDQHRLTLTIYVIYLSEKIHEGLSQTRVLMMKNFMTSLARLQETVQFELFPAPMCVSLGMVSMEM